MLFVKHRRTNRSCNVRKNERNEAVKNLFYQLNFAKFVNKVCRFTSIKVF